VIRVLSYNIRYGGTGREAALAAVVRAADPDVVMLQEATDPAVVRALSEATGLGAWGARPGHSTGFLSRLPVESHAWHHPRGSRHPFLEVALAPPAPRRFGLHLSAWFSRWSEQRRAREIRALLDGIRAHQEGFHAIAGDFNALAPGAPLDVRPFPRWIRAMIWVSGNEIGRDTIQTMLDRHYVDAWRLLRAHEDGYSFPTWDPHVRLDYFFTPARYGERIARVEVLTGVPEARTASDHFPLLVELDLEPGTLPA
jgi:exodeoxyribonuclease-3